MGFSRDNAGVSRLRKAVHAAQDRDLMRLSPAERIRLALRLGDDDLALLCAGRGITPEAARAAIRADRERGRRPLRRVG